MLTHTCITRVFFPSILLAALLAAAPAALAQGSGTMKGRVLDNDTGEPLFGANVVFQGTSLGAATDMLGNYVVVAVPAGLLTVRVSYLGYAAITREVRIVPESTVVQDFRLKAQVLQGHEVVVTAQAKGQNAAINQQLSSDNVVNVVSAARIQELPDANAAESVGRLPGVSLLRSGGQATEVVIRGLQPQYNSITIDGVAIPSNDAGTLTINNGSSAPASSVFSRAVDVTAGGRAVDLSMISSHSLEGIEVYKTASPDIDGAFLGGTVNFGLREARATPSGEPAVSLLAQGAYKDLVDTYHDYKFVASAEQRLFDDRFGVFVQGIAQRQNLTSNQLGGAYYQPDAFGHPDSIVLGSLGLTFSPVDQRRYDGTASLDYRIPDGKIVLVNLVSYGKTTSESHSETYDGGRYGNDIQFGTSLSTNVLKSLTNIMEFDQALGVFSLTAKVSNAYADNRTPGGWSLNFDQISAGTGAIPASFSPAQFSSVAAGLINLNNMKWQGNTTWSSFNKQDDAQFALDLKGNFTLTDLVSVTLKAGG
ncbi:MAG TPA: carboxypeptidase-like regulatory domain-containing protein, partial [Bacteroidota bacterium]|nr:carboxypeptidase-like regulatory domain-containing protein [Bacteroidota bacterium]